MAIAPSRTGRWLAGFVLALAAAVVRAEMTDGTYSISPIMNTSGGGTAASATHQVDLILGQSTPLAESNNLPTSGTHTFEPGFWYMVTGSEAPGVWVSADGDDGNSGTEGSPFATIQHAIDVVNDGDVIRVGPGEFQEALVIDGRLTIEGSGSGSDPGSDTIIVAPAAGHGIAVTGSGASDTELLAMRNLRVTNPTGGTPSVAEHCGGITLDASGGKTVEYVLIEDVIVAGCRGLYLGHGVYVKGVDAATDTVQHVTIRSCQLISNGGCGVFARGATVSDFEITGNSRTVIAGNAYAGILFEGDNVAGQFDGITVSHTDITEVVGTTDTGVRGYAGLFLLHFDGQLDLLDVDFTCGVPAVVAHDAWRVAMGLQGVTERVVDAWVPRVCGAVSLDDVRFLDAAGAARYPDGLLGVWDYQAFDGTSGFVISNCAFEATGDDADGMGALCVGNVGGGVPLTIEDTSFDGQCTSSHGASDIVLLPGATVRVDAFDDVTFTGSAGDAAAVEARNHHQFDDPSCGLVCTASTARTVLDVDDAAGQEGGGVVLTAALETEATAPVGGVDVQFYAGDTFAGSATTDAVTGVATLNWMISVPVGVHDIVATYGGNVSYHRSAGGGRLDVQAAHDYSVLAWDVTAGSFFLDDQEITDDGTYGLKYPAGATVTIDRTDEPSGAVTVAVTEYDGDGAGGTAAQVMTMANALTVFQHEYAAGRLVLYGNSRLGGPWGRSYWLESEDRTQVDGEWRDGRWQFRHVIRGHDDIVRTVTEDGGG